MILSSPKTPARFLIFYNLKIAVWLYSCAKKVVMRHGVSQSYSHLRVLQIPVEAQNAQFAGWSTCHASTHGKSTTVYFAGFAVKSTMHAISAKPQLVSCMNVADCSLIADFRSVSMSPNFQESGNLAIKGRAAKAN